MACNHPHHSLTRAAGYYASGFSCGVLVSILTSPVHRVKILMQTSNISAGSPASSAWGRSFSSLADTVHCYKSVVAEGGVRNLCIPIPSLASAFDPRPSFVLLTQRFNAVVSHAVLLLRYHGYSVQLAVESLGRGAYFSAYEMCKQYFIKDNGDMLLPLHHRVASGAAAGLVGW